MKSKRTARVSLRESRTGSEVSTLEVYLNDDDDLVMAGYDAGKSVKEFWGDSDYEYWRTVKSEHVPEVLLQLIKDRFDNHADYHAWLEEKGIPNEFFSWV